MKACVALACALMAGAAFAQETTYSGGDGSSCEQAVVPRAAQGRAMVDAQ